MSVEGVHEPPVRIHTAPRRNRRHAARVVTLQDVHPALRGRRSITLAEAARDIANAGGRLAGRPNASGGLSSGTMLARLSGSYSGADPVLDPLLRREESQ
jgi:hypothetical protein